MERIGNGWGPARRAGALLMAVALVATASGCRWPGGPPTSTTTTSTSTTTTTAPPTGGASWTMWGRDLANSHHQPGETAIGAGNVATLAPRWVATLRGDISATPTVLGGVAYVPDWGGGMSAIATDDGRVIWQRDVKADYVAFGGAVSRTSPAVVGDDLVLGLTTNQSNSPLGGPSTGPTDPANPFQGAWMIRIRRSDGGLVWKRQVDTQLFSQITSNPVVHDGRVLVGVSSNEWNFTGVIEQSCCTFRGSVVSLDAGDGTVRWRTPMIPDAKVKACNPWFGIEVRTGCGYSGAAVWATPAVDAARGAVYVGTGQNYTVPDAVRPCITAARAAQRPDSDCADPDNHANSLVALDLATGAIRWGRQVLPFDPWHMGCVLTPGWGSCPAPYGPDFDLGSSPNLFSAGGRDIVGSGQKSGTYWALDRDTGAELWHTDVGPGSRLGGIEWGTAYDGTSVYAPIANIEGRSYTGPDGTVLAAGSWAALDPATGRIRWQTADPGARPNWALAPPTVANGVMYGASLSSTGPNLYALDTATGRILWRFASGSSSIAAPAVVDGVVYWGTGYGRLGGTKGDKLYAFSPGGR